MKSIDKKAVQEPSSNNTRRKFLVRGAVTTLVASLPAKVTWAGGGYGGGCTVSGTLSGNTSTVCDTAGVYGRSPYKWKKASWHSHQLRQELDGLVWRDVFLGGPDRATPHWTPNFYWLLENGSNTDKHLIAGYLNAKHGKYPLAAGVSAIDYALMLQQEAYQNESALINALQQTYTDY